MTEFRVNTCVHSLSQLLRMEGRYLSSLSTISGDKEGRSSPRDTAS